MKFFRRVMRAVLVCAVLSVVLEGCPNSSVAPAGAKAGLTEDQVGALGAKAGSGDKAALGSLMTEAREGNPYAQLFLGILYANGQGVPQDYGQAAQWYRRAADQGEADAQNNLGRLYDNGQGVPQDHGQAVQWYRKAAEQGSAVAQFNLGVAYAKGRGVPQDQGQAAQWYRKAAEQGFAAAQFNLGVAYAKGEGVSRNNVAAYALLDLSAAQISSSGDDELSEYRSSLIARMTQQEIEAGQALARKMSAPGQFLKALDDYLASSHSAADSATQSPPR
jgi:hypothetical protein